VTKKTLSCLDLTYIQVSGALSLPVMLIGYVLGQHFSIQESLMPIFIGNAVLCVMACLYMPVIQQHNMTTIDFATYLFGQRGALLCALGMVTSLVGWSAIQLHLSSSIFSYPMIGILIMTMVVMLVSAKEINGLANVNKLLLPALIASLLYLLFSTTGSPAIMKLNAPLSLQVGIVLVITAGCGIIFDLPTFYRFSQSTKSGTKSLLILFLMAYPLIEGFGVYLSRLALGSGTDVSQFLQQFNRVSLVFLLLSGMIASCLNLYSASIIINRTTKLSYLKSLVIVSVCSGLLAFIDIQEHYALFLEIMNVCAEILGVLVLTYIVIHRVAMPAPSVTQKKMHLLFFLVSMFAIIFSRLNQFSLTGDLFLDVGILTSFFMVVYYLPNLLGVRA
jgi:purine-cytosine permease-like protein